MNVSLSGKTTIVTGAASGIGLATALKFLEADAKGVVAVDIGGPPATLVKAGGDRLKFVRGDIGVEKTAEEFTRVALAEFGRIDVLVNNAGICLIKPIHEHTVEDWDRVMNVNIRGVFFAVRHVVPVMMRQKCGVILNTGSISGEVGIPGQGAYAPSKGALHEMTRQMAVEYAAYGIRVNAIGCGTIDTPLVHKAAEESGDPEKLWASLRDNHPIGRVAAADEVASFFTYMASDLASFFTGSILMMDGGFTAR
jgi:dihydroanticapsin dehydrogenase